MRAGRAKPVSANTEWRRYKANQRREELEEIAAQYSEITDQNPGYALEDQLRNRGITVRYCDVMKRFDIDMGCVRWEVSTKQMRPYRAELLLRDKLWQIAESIGIREVFDDILEEVEVQTEEPLLIVRRDGHDFPCYSYFEAQNLLRLMEQEAEMMEKYPLLFEKSEEPTEEEILELTRHEDDYDFDAEKEDYLDAKYDMDVYGQNYDDDED